MQNTSEAIYDAEIDAVQRCDLVFVRITQSRRDYTFHEISLNKKQWCYYLPHHRRNSFSPVTSPRLAGAFSVSGANLMCAEVTQ